MATITENLQIIKNSTDAIKQAIIDKGGTISGDITTWASTITKLADLKKFNINECEFLFENGMTWYNFINSVYNVNHFIPWIYSSDKITHSQNLVYDGAPISTSSSQLLPIYVTEKIIPNGQYYSISNMSGGSPN